MPKKKQTAPSETIAVAVGRDRELLISADDLDYLLARPIAGRIKVREHVVVGTARKRFSS